MAVPSTYVLQWVGPFKSRSEISKYERAYKDESYHLYLFQAKRKNKQKFTYYCGKAVEQSVHKRMGNTNHHIRIYEEERPESILIWIASFANIKGNPSGDDVAKCENMLISILHQIQTDEEHNDNATSYYAPKENIYIINEWYCTPHRDKDGRYIWDEYKSSDKLMLPNMIPDVIALYVSDEDKQMYYCKSLSRKVSMY